MSIERYIEEGKHVKTRKLTKMFLQQFEASTVMSSLQANYKPEEVGFIKGLRLKITGKEPEMVYCGKPIPECSDTITFKRPNSYVSDH